MCPLCKRRMARVHVLHDRQIVNSFDVEEREEPVVIPDEDDPVDEDAEESMNESDDPVSDEGCESWMQECKKISPHGCGSTASPTRCVRSTSTNCLTTGLTGLIAIGLIAAVGKSAVFKDFVPGRYTSLTPCQRRGRFGAEKKIQGSAVATGSLDLPWRHSHVDEVLACCLAYRC